MFLRAVGIVNLSKEAVISLFVKMNGWMAFVIKRNTNVMNVPTESVKNIVEVLPGIKSPTIIPLADENWCSIHTVLDEKRFWEIIGKLKELGAQGILVSPIEKMIL